MTDLQQILELLKSPSQWLLDRSIQAQGKLNSILGTGAAATSGYSLVADGSSGARWAAPNAARIYRAAAHNFATGGWASVPLDTKGFDYYDGTAQVDLASNRIVIRRKGVYQIDGHVGFTATWAGLKGICVSVAGAQRFTVHDDAMTDCYMATGGLWECSVGDAILLQAYNLSGATKALDVARVDFNSLSVALVRPT